MANTYIRLGIDFTSGGGGGGASDGKVKVTIGDTSQDFLNAKLDVGSNKLTKTIQDDETIETLILDVDDSNIDHNSLTNYEADQHRVQDDTQTTETTLWSSQKTQDELDGKVSNVGVGDADKLVKTTGDGQVSATGISVDASNNITGVQDLTITGDLTVNGTTTTVNTETLDVEDANITLNKNGDQAGADNALSGITVEMSDATDAALGYDSTLQSKFKVGEIGDLKEIVTTEHSQVITNKTIDSATNTLTVDADEATVENIEADNFKTGVINTDLSGSVTDSNLASSLAIKTFVEDSIQDAADFTPSRVYYVDAIVGDDTFSGSQQKPFKTIQAAIDAATEIGTLIYVYTGVYNEDLVLAGKNNLTVLTEGVIDSPVTFLLGTVDLTDSKRIRFKNFGIQKATTEPVIKLGSVNPDPGLEGSSRHYFENCAISNLTSGQKVLEVGEGVTEFNIFRGCSFTGEISLPAITSTGSSLSLLECTSENSSISVGTNQTILAVDCYSIGNIVHTNGVVYLKDIHAVGRDGLNRFLVSSASFSPSNLIYLEDVNLYDPLQPVQYATLNIPSTLFILNGCSRNGLDVLNESLRLTRGQQSFDIHYENTGTGLSSDNVQDAITELDSRNVLTSEPTGYPNRTDTAISFDDGSLTFQIAPTGASFDFYIAGKKFTKTTAQSVVIPDSEGSHYIYFDVDGQLKSTQTFTIELFTEKVITSIVYWDATNKNRVYFADERHGLVMDSATHIHFHNSFGARFTGGLALQDFSVDQSGDLDSHAQFTSDSGTIRDEDILVNITAQSQIPVLYRAGADGDWRKKAADAFPMIYSGTAGYTGVNSRLPFNEFSGGTWQLTEADNNVFVLIHFFGTNDVDNGVVGIQGQNQYNNISQARTGANLEISSLSGLPFAEFVPIGSVIVETSSAYLNTPKAKVRSTDIGEDYVDFRGTQLFTPAGSASDHGLLSGLSDDDHTQYHTDSRADAWLATKSTTDLTEGTNLYFTDEKARTAAVVNTTDGNEIDQAPSVAALKAYVSGSTPSGALAKASGDIDLTSFTGAAGASNAPVTGLAFDELVVRSFKALISVSRDADSDLFEAFEILGLNRGGVWEIAYSSLGDSSGVSFDIDNDGQITYTSNSPVGHVETTMSFRALVTHI